MNLRDQSAFAEINSAPISSKLNQVSTSGGCSTSALATSNTLKSDFVLPNETTYTTRVISSTSDHEIGRHLFDALSEMKIFYSQIARYKSLEWKNEIFKDLDRLLDEHSWSDETNIIEFQSFKTFLRFLVFSSPLNIPGLGVAQTNNLIAGWKYRDQTITVEFLPSDMATAIVKRQTERGTEKAAWSGEVSLLKDFIFRFGNELCLNGARDGEKQSET